MKITEAQFLKDVARHELSVISDVGVRRHIRFSQPGTTNMYFDLITWPGYLCFSGDMGTYVFRRLNDMFEFFRTDRPQKMDGHSLGINPGYWGEKLESVDRNGGYREWSKDKFKDRLIGSFDEWIENRKDVNHCEAKELFDELLSSLCDCGKEEAYKLVQDFEVEGKFPFEDWWEVDTDEYTFRFIWCCYALAWGISKYDLRRNP